MNKPKVAFVIPAYNEGEVIFSVISNLEKQLKNQKYLYEIIVVDDGSTDNTVKEARKLGVVIVSHILNSGSGGATATGLSYAQQKGFDVAVTLDADGQHKSQDVIEGVALMLKGEHDLLIGSRLLDSKGMSKVKILGNRGLTFVTLMLFGIQVTDSQSGLRVFSRRALEELRWKTSGYEFCSEMLWRAKQQKMSIGEYPIEAIYSDYSQSKGQNNWNAFNIIKSLVQRRIMEIFSE